eukprot:209285_1
MCQSKNSLIMWSFSSMLKLLMAKNWAAFNIFALLWLIGIVIWCIDRRLIIRYWTLREQHKKSTIRSKENHFWFHEEEEIHFIQDLRTLCLSYVGIVIDSDILSHSEHCDLYYLLKWRFGLKAVINPSLLYRATEDTLKARDLSLACNEYKNVLIVLQNEFDNVFGGFTSIGIQSCVQESRIYNVLKFLLSTRINWARDDAAFLYRIRSNSGLPPQIFPVKESKVTKAMRKNMLYHFAFGWNDFMLRISGPSPPVCRVSSEMYEFEAEELVGHACPTLHPCHCKRLEIYQIQL